MYRVKSQSNGAELYRVFHDGAHWTCDCPDYRQHGDDCKHTFDVLYATRLEDIVASNSGAITENDAEVPNEE